VSFTDGCISWEETEHCLRDAADKLRDVLPGRRTPALQRRTG